MTAESPPYPPYATIRQVAERWQVSEKTVRRLITRKELIAHRIGGQLRISADDLRSYEKLSRV